MKKLIRYVMARGGAIRIDRPTDKGIWIVVDFDDLHHRVICEADEIGLGARSMLKFLKKQKRTSHLRLVVADTLTKRTG